MKQVEASDTSKLRTRADSEDADSDDHNCFENCDLVLFAFRCLHGSSLLISLLSLSANVFVIVTYDISYRDLVLRSFETLFCFIIICLELEWKFLIKKLRLFYTFSCRGLLLFHIGMVTMYPKAQFIWIGASAMLLGVFYVCASVCFNLQLYESNRYQNYEAITKTRTNSISV